jgi:hypothetical protein
MSDAAEPLPVYIYDDRTEFYANPTGWVKREIAKAMGVTDESELQRIYNEDEPS